MTDFEQGVYAMRDFMIESEKLGVKTPFQINLIELAYDEMAKKVIKDYATQS